MKHIVGRCDGFLSWHVRIPLRATEGDGDAVFLAGV